MGMFDKSSHEEKKSLLRSNDSGDSHPRKNELNGGGLRQRAESLLSGLKYRLMSSNSSSGTSEYERLHGVPEPGRK